jgi:hypothetical protein
MNFLIDAHLPRHLAFLLREYGYDAIHTLDLTSRYSPLNIVSPGLTAGSGLKRQMLVQ